MAQLACRTQKPYDSLNKSSTMLWLGGGAGEIPYLDHDRMSPFGGASLEFTQYNQCSNVFAMRISYSGPVRSSSVVEERMESPAGDVIGPSDKAARRRLVQQRASDATIEFQSRPSRAEAADLTGAEPQHRSLFPLRLPFRWSRSTHPRGRVYIILARPSDRWEKCLFTSWRIAAALGGLRPSCAPR